MIGAISITTVTFLEDEVYDGGIPMANYDNARVDIVPVEDIDDAVDVIERAGLTFAATGNGIDAANPDGSRIVDYGEGRREDVTARLLGFSDTDANAVIERVG